MDQADPPQLKVRRVEARDHHGIAELAAEIFSGALSAEDWLQEWRWKFTSEFVPVPATASIAEDAEGQIVGHYGSVVHRFKIGGKRHLVGVPVDNMIAAEHRGGHVQVELFRSQADWAPSIDVDFGLGFPNPTAYRVGKRMLGYRDLLRMKVLRVNLSRPLQAVRTMRGLLARGANQGLSVRELENFDPRFDELWRDVSRDLVCTEERTAAFLDWRYRQAPTREYCILGLEKGDELRGYAICTTRANDADPNGCTLLDFLTHPDPAEAALLAHATRTWAAKRGKRWCEAAMTNTWPYCHALLDAGYRWYGREIPVVCFVFTDRVSKRKLEEPDLWYLTGGTLDDI